LRLPTPDLDRRTLLIGGGAGIGLIVAFAAWPRRPRSELMANAGEERFGHFIKIGHDGRVTVAVPQAEAGQGVWTALPQIVADELGAAWENVAVEPAPHAGVYANRLAEQEGWLQAVSSLRRWQLGDEQLRITAGSTSIRAFEQPLREAGAAARAMLIAAAADRWGVEAGECETGDGFVHHSGKALSFGQLAEDAGRRSPPSKPPRRQSRTRRLMGQSLPRLDLPAKSDGSFRFARDVRLPEMLFASARIAPPGGRLTAFSRAGAQQVQGVRDVVGRDSWIAVVAETSWAAERALRAANPHFEAPSAAASRDSFEAELEAGAAERWFSRGDYEAAVRGSRPLAATYWVAPAQHLGLEPLTATARFAGERLEVWAATQAPGFARAVAEKVAGGTELTFYPMPPGDPSGRALEADAIPVVVELARISKRAVQLSLSPGASQNYDRPAPPALARMSALPGPGGITAAWKMRVVTADGLASAMARMSGDRQPSSIRRADAAVPPYAIPHVSLEVVPASFQGGYLRGHPERPFAFFVESFVDELARAAGLEPLAFRMAMLGSSPRLARCIQTAASAGSWDGGGAGSTMGLAALSAYGSYIGLLADASIGADQRVQVHRLVAAVDCGRIVNPQLVRQQIEGGLIAGLNLALVSEPEWVAGMPRSRQLGRLGVQRIARTPKIDVHLVPSGAPAGGVSGLGVAALAPAVANALYASTGKRMRSLPFDPISL
jgi:isoquinoline 1-oxidoreductase beta subunit